MQMMRRKKMINVFGSRVSNRAVRYLKSSISNQWLGMGPNVRKFELEVQNRLGLRNFLLVDSGSNALYMAIYSLNLPPKSEIILPSFTWVSCAQSVLMAGHIPVFCDVDSNTYNVTIQTLQPHISKRTGAIMVVHYGGLPCEMDSIMSLGFPVIEDAAHAIDSYYNGRACGSIGDVGIYSFDAVKNLAMGEGGGITFKSDEAYQRARILRYSGIGKSGFEASTNGKSRWWEYNIVEPFIKMNPSDIHAAVGLEQIESLDRNQSIRKSIWLKYQNAFKELNWLICPVDPPSYSKHSYFTYTVKLNLNRDLFAKYMYESGIYTTLRYHPLHLNKLYNSKVKLKISEELNDTAISLPLHPNLSYNEIRYIINKVKSFPNYLMRNGL
jgi:dTDP-4-amino-4,6-dideoxygalactose transaminase